MPQRPLHPSRGLDRRGFLGLGGAALICGVGGHKLTASTPVEVDEADAAARKLRKPPANTPDPIDEQSFPTPRPQPGGRRREYWIQARSVRWNVAPKGRDEWMNHRIGGRKTFRALVYQAMTVGFAKPAGPARMPGPTIEAEVGDTIAVHFRNADEHFGQPLTVHPHGVRYNPEYDGAYLGNFTRTGGFISPREGVTSTRGGTPPPVGIWPHPDHGADHTSNTLRGAFA